MRSVLLEFEQELSALNDFMASAEAEESLLTMLSGQRERDHYGVQQAVQEIQKNLTNKKRYVYSVAIISLYGALERYVEDVVHSYIDVLAKIVGSYGAIPHAIRQQHMDMSIEYLRAIREEKVRTEETLEAVIQKLAGCINEERVFALNAKAFTLRSGNMSRKRIEEIYRRVEIGTLLRRVDATTVNREYEGNEGVNEHKSDEEVRGLYAEIDEIVEVRNLVAHGALQIDNIEDNELVRQKIEKMRVFGRALYEVLEQEVWRASLGAGRMRELGEPIAKYGTSIACFDLGTGTVRRGEWIVLERNDATQPFRSGVIQSLQVNREDKEEVNGGEGVQVGVGLSMRASSRGKYWIPEEEIVELVSQ